MARALTNKAQVVLDLLRESGEWSCKDIADEIERRNPCGHCGGTGKGDYVVGDSARCRPCWGRGVTMFSYSDAYTVLRQLMARRLVKRRAKLDEWGDETSKLLYFAVEDGADADAADALEQAFRAPAFGESSGA